ncbi:MAG: phosphatidylserine decarboxylase family protein [Desulfobacterales bacterium]|jgi:phosphatidylserine decarboxylase|nr:phosphatidylserine decarboxylase family protein [Desulfobacteraceae bacterium]MBT7084904.1 phosphatidylserine decarboxylase family protein [Desulfobacterales bacterium]MBT7697892.1 phosphatidylserine decarboxylase family protein [Desulfobacterales bacterium]
MDKFTWADSPRHDAFPIAGPGYSVIFAAAFTTAVFALLNFTILALICLGCTFFICFFFRDPDRVIPNKASAVVSPADGKVILVDNMSINPFDDGLSVKISIFMSVFNVHVNRIPYDGIVKKIHYHPGKFFSANLDKASKENEHNAVLIETKEGKKIWAVQIAGLIARRIICKVQEDESVVRGSRFGMICFGSRLDVYLPTDTKIDVSVGDKVQSGASILGYLK